jgi:hypothetical protein
MALALELEAGVGAKREQIAKLVHRKRGGWEEGGLREPSKRRAPVCAHHVAEKLTGGGPQAVSPGRRGAWSWP